MFELLIDSSSVTQVVSVHLNKWKLDRRLGFFCLLMYAVFLCFSILIEFNVFTFVNLPTCREEWDNDASQLFFFELARTMAQVLGQRQTGSSSEGIFIYWSSLFSLLNGVFRVCGIIGQRGDKSICVLKNGPFDQYRFFLRGKIKDDYCLDWCEYFISLKYFAYYIFKEDDLNVFYDGICFNSC